MKGSGMHGWPVALALMLAALSGWCTDSSTPPEGAGKGIRRAEEWRELDARWDSVKAAMFSPIEKLTLPLETYPDGRIKARLSAEKAQIFDKGDTIFAENVRIDLLTPEGKMDGVLWAEGCLVDRKTKRGFCRGMARAVKGGDRIKGRGLYFSFEREYFKILSECEVRTTRIKLQLGKGRGK